MEQEPEESEGVAHVAIWGKSIAEQKPWSRKVHNMLQEKQAPMLLEVESGKRWSQSWGSGQGDVWGARSRRNSKDSEFYSAIEAMRGL